MYQILNLTNDPSQTFTYQVDGGDELTVKLYYYATQKSWFFDISYGDYTCNGMRVTLSYNALRHLKNIIPFGICFYCDTSVEPFDIDDFATGRVTMNILTQDEVEQIEQEVFLQ